MSAYTLALFFHIVGALGLFATLVAERVIWGELSRVEDVGQARTALSTAIRLTLVGLGSLLVLFGSGAYLMVSVWGSRPWLTVAMLSAVPLTGLSGALTLPRIGALRRALARESNPLPKRFSSELRRPVLMLSNYVRSAIVLAVVFLMTTKPGAGSSLLALLAATALGIGVAIGTRTGSSIGEA